MGIMRISAAQYAPAALKRHRRELIDPKIAKIRGGIIKTIANGALIEFGSAVDAVRTRRDRRHHHVPVIP
jgi:class 3 adenylate cyclase